ncbi:MAG: DUF1573 domain-containing protein [Flavobacteriales bacterium]
MQYVRAGDAAAEEGKWDEAFSYYQQGYELDTTSFEMLVKYADAARMVKYYAVAERLYAKAFDKDAGKLNPDGLYYLAWMQKYNGRYEDAQRNFKKYLKKFKNKGSKDLLDRAEQEAKSALWALNYKVPADVKQAFPTGENINTDGSEVNLIEKDFKYYVASRNEVEGGKWKMYCADSSLSSAHPMNIESINETAEVGSYSFFNQTVYFSVRDSDVTKIYRGNWHTEEIFEVEEVKELNTEGTMNTMPVMTQIGEDMYFIFASDREGGEGGMDLWMATFDGSNASKPMNMGRVINTPGDELTPSFAEGKFYFSSDWHEGFGGLDIFSCTYDNAVFSKPVNIGPPYNSSANDFYYALNHTGDKAYLSSNREGNNNEENQTCCNDVYEVLLKKDEPTETEQDPGKLKLMDLMATIPVVLYFHNDEPNPDVWDTTTTLTYMQAYDSYMNLVPTYLKENTKGLSAEKKEEAEQITGDFFDLKVKKGVDDLNLFADALLAELNEGQSLKIQVRGFASPRAKSDYNLNLTKRRTSSLVNYLMIDRYGAFRKYIDDTAENGAHLEFELIPFGEVKADRSVSDDLVDEKNSIYARSACLERKIEIENVVQIPNTVRFAAPVMDTTVHDFGKINHREPVRHTFYISNDGNAPMYIDSIMASCGCTEPKISKSVIMPGEKVELEVGFNPFGKKAGVDVETATIYVRGREPIVLTIKAEVTK